MFARGVIIVFDVCCNRLNANQLFVIGIAHRLKVVLNCLIGNHHGPSHAHDNNSDFMLFILNSRRNLSRREQTTIAFKIVFSGFVLLSIAFGFVADDGFGRIGIDVYDAVVFLGIVACGFCFAWIFNFCIILISVLVSLFVFFFFLVLLRVINFILRIKIRDSNSVRDCGGRICNKITRSSNSIHRCIADFFHPFHNCAGSVSNSPADRLRTVNNCIGTGLYCIDNFLNEVLVFFLTLLSNEFTFGLTSFGPACF